MGIFLRYFLPSYNGDSRLEGCVISVTSLETQLTQRHYQPIPLWQQGISTLYGLGASVHRWAYQWLPVKTLPVPVISIGNLTAGGTGKTPVTIAIAQYLIQQGKTVLVLSRGYRANALWQPSQPLTADHGDEPYCIQQAVPTARVWVGQNRVALAQLALVQHPDIDLILLDDGHHHYPLHKTLDIILIDAERGIGNGHCLPFGPLRAPLPPDATGPVVWVHKHTDTTVLPTLPWQPPKYQTAIELQTVMTAARPSSDHSPLLTPGPVQVMTGVANPAPLLRWLADNGYSVVAHHQQADHCAFTPQDWQNALANQARLVVTRKDWVKIPPPVQLALADHTGIADLEATLSPALQGWIDAVC